MRPVFSCSSTSQDNSSKYINDCSDLPCNTQIYITKKCKNSIYIIPNIGEKKSVCVLHMCVCVYLSKNTYKKIYKS